MGADIACPCQRQPLHRFQADITPDVTGPAAADRQHGKFRIMDTVRFMHDEHRPGLYPDGSGCRVNAAETGTEDLYDPAHSGIREFIQIHAPHRVKDPGMGCIFADLFNSQHPVPVFLRLQAGS